MGDCCQDLVVSSLCPLTFGTALLRLELHDFLPAMEARAPEHVLETPSLARPTTWCLAAATTGPWTRGKLRMPV
jgi:hypothetical protein